MEFLDSSRSAKKLDPQRTPRYKRADPRATNVILGYGYHGWETTNKTTQRLMKEGTNKLGAAVTSDRHMTAARKRGILSSSVSFGSEPTDYRTESTNYSTHDLKTWGPRTTLQKDSYSWTEKERFKLSSLRVKGNPVSGNPVKFDPYIKLPPIVGSTSGNGEIISKSNGEVEEKHQTNLPSGSVRKPMNYGRYYNEGQQRVNIMD